MSGCRFPYQHITCGDCGYEAKYKTQNLYGLKVVCESCGKSFANYGRTMIEADDDHAIGWIEVVELIINLEDKFNVEFLDEEIEPIEDITIHNLCKLISSKLDQPIDFKEIVETIYEECKDLDIAIPQSEFVSIEKVQQIKYRLDLLADLLDRIQCDGQSNLDDEEINVCVGVYEKLLPIVAGDEIQQKDYEFLYQELKKVKTISVPVFKIWVILRRLGINSDISMPEKQPWFDN